MQGQTSLTEALLYRSGAISRMCKVEDGQTTTDFEPEEIKRGVSVSATLAPVEWNDVKINFLDTPGFADFVAEVKGAFRAVDSVLIVVSATSGVPDWNGTMLESRRRSRIASIDFR